MTTPSFQTQSARDEQADLAARHRSGKTLNKKQWFEVPDSELLDADGNGTGVYNVQAQFADHYILNVAKSKAARVNVYDVGTVLHTKVMQQVDESPAHLNATSQVLRFDKGEDKRVASWRPGPDGKEVIHYEGRPGMGKEGFDAAVNGIMRCWDAWEHYQKFRKAPVLPMELAVLAIINEKPLDAVGTLLVDRGDGVLERVKADPDRPDDDDEDDAPPPARVTKPKRARKA